MNCPARFDPTWLDGSLAGLSLHRGANPLPTTTTTTATEQCPADWRHKVKLEGKSWTVWLDLRVRCSQSRHFVEAPSLARPAFSSSTRPLLLLAKRQSPSLQLEAPRRLSCATGDSERGPVVAKMRRFLGFGAHAARARLNRTVSRDEGLWLWLWLWFQLRLRL